MRSNFESEIDKLSQRYCENELKDFMKSNILNELNAFVKSLNFKVECNFGRGKNELSRSLILSISILNQCYELVETMDGGLTTATILISKENKKKTKFFSWFDDEKFIKDLKWIITSLKELCSKKSGI